MGNKTYGLPQNLCAPEKPSSLSFKDIVETLKQHLSPKSLLIAERFPLHRRNQPEGETVSTYLTGLRKLSLYCEFGTNLDDSLRDRLVCGLHNELLQKRLLSKPNLSLAKATGIALALEAAAKDTLELQRKNEQDERDVIIVVPMNSHQSSVILGTNLAGNARKWDTFNTFAARERVKRRPAEGEQRKRTGNYIPLR